MSSNPLGMSPWDYIVGGLVLALVAGGLAILDLTLVAWLAAVLASLALAIGTLAQIAPTARGLPSRTRCASASATRKDVMPMYDVPWVPTLPSDHFCAWIQSRTSG